MKYWQLTSELITPLFAFVEGVSIVIDNVSGDDAFIECPIINSLMMIMLAVVRNNECQGNKCRHN